MGDMGEMYKFSMTRQLVDRENGHVLHIVCVGVLSLVPILYNNKLEMHLPTI